MHLRRKVVVASEQHSIPAKTVGWKPAVFSVNSQELCRRRWRHRSLIKLQHPEETSCRSRADCSVDIPVHMKFIVTLSHRLLIAHCSSQCHLSPITLYYANSSLNGYCSARHQCCHSSDWQLQNMCSMGCHLLQKHWFFSDTLFCLCVTLRFKHDTHTSNGNWERLRLYKRSRTRNGNSPLNCKHLFWFLRYL